MKSVKRFAVIAAVLACGVSSARAGEQLVLEEVVVRAKAPARPAIELVVVVAEMPEHLKTEQRAEEPVEVALAVERPRVDPAAFDAIEPAPPTLRL